MADPETFALRNRIIGVLLQDARARAGKSRRECAALLEVPVSTIVAFEEGRRPISLPELEALASFLGVPVSHFWDEHAHLLSEEPFETKGEAVRLRQRIVGALLQQARTEEGRTKKELANALGCSTRRISAYEYGERPIPLPELELLAQVVERPLEYFLDEESNQAARRGDMVRAFLDLPEEIRDFVSRPINRSYLELAMKLADMPAGTLRGIAEGLLEITY